MATQNMTLIPLTSTYPPSSASGSLPRCDHSKIRQRRKKTGELYKENQRCYRAALWQVGSTYYCDPHFNQYCDINPEIDLDLIERLCDDENHIGWSESIRD